MGVEGRQVGMDGWVWRFTHGLGGAQVSGEVKWAVMGQGW